MNKKTTMTWERLFFVWNQWPLVPSEGPLETAFGKLGPMKNDFRSLEKRQCSTKSDIFCAGAATWLAAWEWSKIHWRLGCWIQSLLLLLGYSFFFSLICLFWGVMPPSRGECGLILLEMLGIAPEWDVTSLCGKSGLFSLFFAGPCFLLLLCLSSRWVEAWWTQSLLIDTGSENDLAYLDNQSGIWWSSLKRKPINYQWSPFLGAIYLFLINHWQ